MGADGKQVSVISTINGDANVGFYKELAAANVSADDIGVAFSVGEEAVWLDIETSTPGCGTTSNPLKAKPTKQIVDPESQMGDARVTSDPMEAHHWLPQHVDQRCLPKLARPTSTLFVKPCTARSSRT